MPKLSKRVWIPVAALLVVAGVVWFGLRVCCAPPPEDCCAIAVPVMPLSPADVFAKLRDAIVVVEVQFEAGSAQPVTRTGTGFVVTGDGHIATAAELLAPPAGANVRPRITVTFRTGQSLQTTGQPLVGAGMALLKIDVPTVLPQLRLSFDSLPVAGATGYLAAFVDSPTQAHPTEPLLVTLVVRTVDPNGADGEARLVLDAVAGSAFRGAPVLDREGRVIGVALHGDPTDSRTWIAVPARRLAGVIAPAPPRGPGA